MYVWVLVLAACYEPKTEAACEVRCTVNPANPDERGPCPAGLTCGADGLCRQADGTCGGDMPDASLTSDGPAGTTCYGTNPILRPCLSSIPPGTRSAEGGIDTSNAASCTVVFEQPGGGPEVCVIAGEDVSVANLRAVGTRPLVVVATGTITITDSIDLASHPGSAGAGASFAGCVVGTAPQGGSGGGGGSFQTIGGTGGSSDGATRGNPSALAPEVTFARGGCAGANGGNLATQALGAGGAGGGALVLIAQNIQGNGAIINASGQGGQGGAVMSGGGGGGSGGLVVFDAAEIDLGTSSVFANGGGGGQGGAPGVMGGDGGESTVFSMAAPGGNLSSRGGAGGNGSVGAGMGGSATGTTTGFGAGGGGGGAGYIFIYGPRDQAFSISPPPLP